MLCDKTTSDVLSSNSRHYFTHLQIHVIAALLFVSGMVGAMIRHLNSLRRMERDYGWIHTLLEGQTRFNNNNTLIHMIIIGVVVVWSTIDIGEILLSDSRSCTSSSEVVCCRACRFVAKPACSSSLIYYDSSSHCAWFVLSSCYDRSGE